MSDIKREKFFETAREVAIEYGFSPVDKLIESYKGSSRENIRINAIAPKGFLNDLSSILKFYFERGLHREKKPLFIFHSTIDEDTKHAVSSSTREEESRFCLTVLGIEDPFSEAFLIATADRILKELKVGEKIVRINSMGDRQAAERYYITLRKSFRKYIDLASGECAKTFNVSCTEAHKFIFDEEHTDLANQLPTTLKFLSEQDRNHFKMVIEYLDAHEIAYELASDVVNDVKHGIHTTFEIKCNGDNIRAVGARYDTLPTHLFKRKTPISSISIVLENDTSKGTYKAKNKKNRSPKIFLLHVGYNARLKSIPLLSKLRDAKIQVEHRLHRAKISDQIEDCNKRPEYTIILGQEEVNNNTIRFKKTATKSIKIVNLKDLERTIKLDVRLRR